jgi:hypothetical protein
MAHSDFFTPPSSPIQKFETRGSTASSTSFKFFDFRSLASELASDEAFAAELVVVFNFWSRCDRRLHHWFLHSPYVRHLYSYANSLRKFDECAIYRRQVSAFR